MSEKTDANNVAAYIEDNYSRGLAVRWIRYTARYQHQKGKYHVGAFGSPD